MQYPCIHTTRAAASLFGHRKVVKRAVVLLQPGVLHFSATATPPWAPLHQRTRAVPVPHMPLSTLGESGSPTSRGTPWCSGFNRLYFWSLCTKLTKRISMSSYNVFLFITLYRGPISPSTSQQQKTFHIQNLFERDNKQNTWWSNKSNGRKPKTLT